MNTTTIIAIYFLIWWITLFAVLPFGVRSQGESGEMAPGTDPGAPIMHRLLAKFLWTTAIAFRRRHVIERSHSEGKIAGNGSGAKPKMSGAPKKKSRAMCPARLLLFVPYPRCCFVFYRGGGDFRARDFPPKTWFVDLDRMV